MEEVPEDGADVAFFTEVPEGHWDRLYHCQNSAGHAWTFRLPEREQSPHSVQGRLGEEEHLKLGCKVRSKESSARDLTVAQAPDARYEWLTTVHCGKSKATAPQLTIAEVENTHADLYISGIYKEAPIKNSDFSCHRGPMLNPNAVDRDKKARLISCPLGKGERLHALLPSKGKLQVQVTSKGDEGIIWTTASRGLSYDPASKTQTIKTRLPSEQALAKLDLTMDLNGDVPTITGTAKVLNDFTANKTACQELVIHAPR